MALQAQTYNTALGLRFGDPSGITVKHFVSNSGAVEGIAGFSSNHLTFTGLYEFHASFFGANRLNWYFGPGLHAGWHFHNKNPWWKDDFNDDNHVIFGGDLIIGLEYTFVQLPLNLSLDWKPGINIIGHQNVFFNNGAISIRFAF